MKLKAKLFEIDGRRIEGLKLRDALRQAYDAIAEDVPREERNEEALTGSIPERVFEEAIRLGWIKAPGKESIESNPGSSATSFDHPLKARERWLPDTSGWLDGLRAHHASSPQPGGASKPVMITVAGVDVSKDYWQNVWLPIFAGRVQAWRAKLSEGEESRIKRVKTFPKRAKWFRDRLVERGWSETELADFGGLARKTVARILNGQPVNPKSISAAIEGLNQHGRAARIRVEDVPDN